MRRLLFILLFFLKFIQSHTQESGYAFRNVNINEGLSQNSVVDIACDSLGFMWFATQDGLNRYDGLNFQKFPYVFDDVTTSSDNSLGKLAVGRDKMWMITAGGKIEVLNSYTHKTTPFTLPGKENIEITDATCLLTGEKNNLWIGTLKGLYYCDFIADKVVLFNGQYGGIKGKVHQIFTDSKKVTWVVADEGLFVINSSIGKPKALPGSNNFRFSYIFEDKNETIWAGTFGKGLFLKEKNEEAFKPFAGWGKYSLPGSLVIYSILADNEDRIWVGTYANGLYLINQKKLQIQHFVYDVKNPFSLGFNDVLSIKKDNKGGIWIGTDGGGVSYFNERLNFFRQFSERNIADNISIDQIRSIVKDQENRLWLGTSGKGLTKIDLQSNTVTTFHLTPYKNGVPNFDRIVSLFNNNKNTIWAGTQGNGLLLLRKSDGSVVKWFHTEAKNKIPDNTIWDIVPENEQQIWIGTRYKGLCLVDKEKGLIQHYLSDEKESNTIIENNVQAIKADGNENLFLGFATKGIQVFNRRTKQFSMLAEKCLQRLFNNQASIKCFYYSKPYLLAGTSGKGLLIIDTKTDSLFVINEEKGLANNTVYGILPESENTIWVSTNKGLCRLHFLKGFQYTDDVKFNYYTADDGLQSNEFNTGAHFQAGDGEIFLGGIKGVNFFNPVGKKYEDENRLVRITSLLVDNVPLAMDTLIAFKKNIRLKYAQNSIAFNYAALDYVSPGKINYEYMLENYENKWVDAGQRTYVAYTNLSPGHYTFRVRIAGNNKDDGSVSALSIFIRPPLWMRWWFIAAGVLLITAFLYGIYRYRINQLLKVQQIRNEISADLHDDIGSRLTNIQLLSAISRQKLSGESGAVASLNQIDEQVQSSAEALDEIVWNMKSKDEDVGDIAARMRRYAGEVFETDGINYKVQIDHVFAGHKLSMEKRRDLLLVYREIINNIRKHAGAKSVEIKVDSNQQGNFHLYIKDDGKGFDITKPTSRNGLQNIRNRIDRWQGKVNIQSAPKMGTSIDILVPFDKKSLIRRIFQGLI